MKKAIKIIIAVMMIATISIIIVKINKKEQEEIIPIKSKNQLEKIYNKKIGEETTLNQILKLPFSLIVNIYDGVVEPLNSFEEMSIDSAQTTENATNEVSTKEYSTTNIQVENVDEADITKTDGNYIYSISENNVIITDVRNPEEMKIIAKISQEDSNTIPGELILYKDKLIIIYEIVKSRTYYSSYNNKNTTYVVIYDITNKEAPKEVKNYELEQQYNTSRCIEGKLYVIASGKLKKENNEIVTYYKEDKEKIDLGYNNINQIKDLNTDSQTILSMFNLNQIEEKVKISSYLMNIENAYISENNIYLLDEKYKGSYWKKAEIKDIFGWKGLIGAFYYKEKEDNERGYYTEIYKFNLLENGTIKYDKKASEKGKTINQFSIDEYKDNLRMALYDYEGARVVILDKNMKKIGETEKLAEGESMYSSRFLGEKAYLVTYKTIDPLFVIDLSKPSAPKVLGELKIPGYSTYLHPYDENHIIGIGMQTEEKINRNASGKVISTTATITGMKMALFDVSNVNNPIQISEAIIGDRRTTSAILTNHKALLFSKEKQLLAIPVNNYKEDFEINALNDSNDLMVKSYINYDKEFISEGYFVYQINITDGLNLKGTITHEKTKTRYNMNSKLLRGLYIDDNLYTISEDYIKINQLEDLKEVNQIKIKEN